MWGRDGVGPSMAPLVLLTVDPAVRDARRGAAIVDPSPDLDFRTRPRGPPFVLACPASTNAFCQQ